MIVVLGDYFCHEFEKNEGGLDFLLELRKMDLERLVVVVKGRLEE